MIDDFIGGLQCTPKYADFLQLLVMAFTLTRVGNVLCLTQ